MSRKRVPTGREEVQSNQATGALELLLELLEIFPHLGPSAPLMQTWSTRGWRVITRNDATMTLRQLATCAGKDPMQYALHSGRIGGATKLAAQGASPLQIQRAGRWKSQVFMTYVRAEGEGAQFVSEALTCS